MHAFHDQPRVAWFIDLLGGYHVHVYSARSSVARPRKMRFSQIRLLLAKWTSAFVGASSADGNPLLERVLHSSI